MSDPRRGSDRLAVALLIILPTLLFADVILGVANFAMRDLTRFYHPTKQIYRQIVAGGEFPLWNRYSHGGQPLAANPEHAIFYPLTWLLMLPDFELGYRLHILIHIYIALFAMYALLRSMRARAPAAFFGAVSWGLGGVFLSYVNLLPYLFCAAWLPLTCLYARRFLRDGRRRDFGLASLFLGLQCLVAEPTTLIQTGLILGMYGLHRGWPSIRAMARTTVLVAVIAVCGFAVGAVQLLPAADLTLDSVRARSFSFDVVASWSMPWGKLAEFLYPNVLGHVRLEGGNDYWGERLYAPMGAPFLFSIYPGLAVAALVAAGIARRARGYGITVVLAAASVLAALGSHTPLLRFLYEAGFAGQLRYPEKFIMMGVFGATVFAALVLDRILDGDHVLRRAAAGFALATAIVAAGVALLMLHPASTTHWRELFAVAASEADALIASARTGWTVAVLRGVLLFAVLAVSRHRSVRWLAAAFLFLCIDLVPVVHELNPRLPSEFFSTTPPVVRTFPASRSEYRLFHLADWQIGDRIGIDHPKGDSRYRIIRNGLFPMTPAAFGIQTVLERDYDMTSLLPTVDFTQSMWDVRKAGRPDWMLPFGAMSNAWYLAVPRRPSGPDDAVARPVEFLEGKRHPRYYFAEQMVSIHSRKDFVNKLSLQSWPDRVAFVAAPAFPPASGTVVTVQETANRASLEVVTEGRAFLVMSVTAHKYWRVTIDGEMVDPIVTNIGYQGVVVDAGIHQVEMIYTNDMILLGALVSVTVALVLATIAIAPSRRRVAVV
ncbi:MAG: hypothetical protein ACXW2P_12040 [Thermoanaerobaculia bacterium]